MDFTRYLHKVAQNCKSVPITIAEKINQNQNDKSSRKQQDQTSEGGQEWGGECGMSSETVSNILRKKVFKIGFIRWSWFLRNIYTHGKIVW